MKKINVYGVSMQLQPPTLNAAFLQVIPSHKHLFSQPKALIFIDKSAVEIAPNIIVTWCTSNKSYDKLTLYVNDEFIESSYFAWQSQTEHEWMFIHKVYYKININ
jgi:hypothetical protein